MDLYFCDICNESVPQSDLENGKAFRRGERVVCAACDHAMSNEEEEGFGDPGVARASEAVSSEAVSSEGVSSEAVSSEAVSSEVVSSEVVSSEGASTEGAAGALGAGVESSAAVEESAGVGAAGVAASSGSGKALSMFLIVVLGGGLLAVLGVVGFLWMEFSSRFEEAGAARQALEQSDSATEKRFRDMQTSLSLQGQEKDSFVRNSFEALSGRMSEKFSNLGNRVGRLENSLEALRLSSTEDRRALEAGAKEASLAAASAKSGFESFGEELVYLTDRVRALEEVLEGGLAVAGGAGAGGKQPNWFSQLVDLKDVSAGNRWNAVTMLGDTGDPRVVPHLLPMLGDQDVFVRMATARVLGDLGSPAAIPGLIDGLSDAQAAVREAAVVALRVLSGKDFRFDPLGRDADRRKTQGAWRKWWEDNSEKLLAG